MAAISMLCGCKYFRFPEINPVGCLGYLLSEGFFKKKKYAFPDHESDVSTNNLNILKNINKEKLAQYLTVLGC